METEYKTRITKDFNEKSVIVSRVFDAPEAKLWEAFTTDKLLDRWWGPFPWRAETKRMNFTPGGYWLYAMVSPENEKHWGRMNYLAIDEYKRFELEDAFCDENGNLNHELPASNGSVVFSQTKDGTRVEFKTVYPTVSDLETLVKMGFEEGISISFDQLEQLLKE